MAYSVLLWTVLDGGRRVLPAQTEHFKLVTYR